MRKSALTLVVAGSFLALILSGCVMPGLSSPTPLVTSLAPPETSLPTVSGSSVEQPLPTATSASSTLIPTQPAPDRNGRAGLATGYLAQPALHGYGGRPGGLGVDRPVRAAHAGWRADLGERHTGERFQPWQQPQRRVPGCHDTAGCWSLPRITFRARCTARRIPGAPGRPRQCRLPGQVLTF